MATIVRAARSSAELHDVLQVRYTALEQAGRKVNRLFASTGKVIDHFDIYPSTINIVAYGNGAAVGTIRALEFLAQEDVLDECFDYRESVKNIKGRSYLLDMFCVVRQIAGHALAHKQILRMALSLLANRECSHVFFSCPEPLLEIAKGLGFAAIAEPVYSEVLGMRIAPLVVELAKFYQQLLEGIADQEIIRFQEVFYGVVFDAGEILVMEGERGNTAYLIQEGEVEVVLAKGDSVVSINTIPAGHMIGEVAMVTNEPRTASLVAKKPTACIAFDRDEFMKLMYAQPQKSLDIFKIFSKRLTESNQRLAQSRSPS